MSLREAFQSVSQKELIDTELVEAIKTKLEIAMLDCQSQIFPLVQAAVPEFCLYNSTIPVLAAKVDDIKLSIDHLEKLWQRPSLASVAVETSGASKGLTSQLKLSAYRTLIKLLECILKVRSSLMQFDSAIEQDYFDIASDAINEGFLTLNDTISQITEINNTSAMLDNNSETHSEPRQQQLGNEELYLTRCLRSQVLQRRSRLEVILSQAVEKMCQVFLKGLEIRQASLNKEMNLEQLWHAVKNSESTLEKVLKQLVSSFIFNIIDPLLIASHNLSENQTFTTNVQLKHHILGVGSNENSNSGSTGLKTSVSNERYQTTIWTWFETACNDESRGDASACSTAITVLESFFVFLSSELFRGHSDLFLHLGRTLWTDLSNLLEAHVCHEHPGDLEILEKLQQLEVKAKGIQLIPSDTTRLQTIEFRAMVFESQRVQVLTKIQQLCCSEDSATVVIGKNVSEDEDILLTSVRTMESATAKEFCVSTTEKENGFSCSQLNAYLEQSPLTMPECQISKIAFDTVKLIEDLLNSTVTSVVNQLNESGGGAATHLTGVSNCESLLESAVNTAREGFGLFCLLRSSYIKENMEEQNSIAAAAVFFCDILYINRKMLLFSTLIHKKVLEKFTSFHARVSFLDLITITRPVQEESFYSILIEKRKDIGKLCESLGDFTQLSLDSCYMMVEARIGEVIQCIKKLFKVWTSILPEYVSSVCVSKLIDHFLSILLTQICECFESNNACSVENMNALVFLLGSTNDQLSSSLDRLSHQIQKLSSTWATFNVFRQFLNADTPEFWSQRQTIREKLTTRQLKVILDINSCQRTLQSRDIMSLIASA